jgi:hypothetical protein
MTTDPPVPEGLLPPGALRGHRIGLSMSDSADLARLGLAHHHVQLAVRELARVVLVGGGTLAYGGTLKPGGFTEFLVGELGQYARTGLLDEAEREPVALLLCLSWQEHRRRSLAELDALDRELGLYGELRCLGLDGQPLVRRDTGRGADAEPAVTDPDTLLRGLTSLREALVRATSARLLIGGRRAGFNGPMPGLMQETLLALDAGHPLYLAGGFGGSTHDLAAAVDPACAALLPPDPAAPPPDARITAALQAVRDRVGTRGWARLNNGLTADENRHLAMTHRPSEIAALVGLGLGRWAVAGRQG